MVSTVEVQQATAPWKFVFRLVHFLLPKKKKGRRSALASVEDRVLRESFIAVR
jgi:hypothetical protein